MSLRKSVRPLGHAIDVWGGGPSGFQLNDSEVDTHTKQVLELLKQQSRPCYEMQQLCIALDAMAGWRYMEDQLTKLSKEQLQYALLHLSNLRGAG
jgi:hypothetical protein